MSLSLKISKKVGGRSDMIASRSWPQNRISIGRGEECTLVLEDPRKHVSRVHVEIEEKDEGRFHLTIVSKVNPVYVNGKKHAPGTQFDLVAGDCFELGEYELELLAPPAPAPAARAGAVVPDVEETTRPGNAQLQMPKEAAAPAAPAPAEVAEATFIGQKVPPVEPGMFEGHELPPVEPGLFDEPATAEAAPTPAAPSIPVAAPAPAPSVQIAAPAPAPAEPEPEADVFAEATYVGASSAAPRVFDEATYVGGRPPPASATMPGIARSIGTGGSTTGMRDAVTVFLEGAGLAGKEIRDAEIEEFLR